MWVAARNVHPREKRPRFLVLAHHAHASQPKTHSAGLRVRVGRHLGQGRDGGGRHGAPHCVSGTGQKKKEWRLVRRGGGHTAPRARVESAERARAGGRGVCEARGGHAHSKKKHDKGSDESGVERQQRGGAWKNRLRRPLATPAPAHPNRRAHGNHQPRSASRGGSLGWRRALWRGGGGAKCAGCHPPLAASPLLRASTVPQQRAGCRAAAFWPQPKRRWGSWPASEAGWAGQGGGGGPTRSPPISPPQTLTPSSAASDGAAGLSSTPASAGGADTESSWTAWTAMVVEEGVLSVAWARRKERKVVFAPTSGGLLSFSRRSRSAPRGTAIMPPARGPCETEGRGWQLPAGGTKHDRPPS